MQQQQQRPDSFNYSELIEEAKDLIRGSWRFRWQAVLLAWIVCLPSWWFVLTMPDIYKASGRLYIDSEDSLRPLLRGLTIESDLLDDVNVMLKSILSRPTLEKIASRSGFDLGDSEAVQEEDLITRLGEQIDVTLDRNQILEISVDHSNRGVALAVVSVLIDEFVEGLLGSSRSDTKSAQDFLGKKLQEYEALLAEAEARLADFKKRNIGQMPGERGGYYDRLQSEMRALETLNSKIRLVKRRRDDLQAQMIGEAPVFGLMSSPAGSGSVTSPQIQQLEAQLTDLRLSYTDAHPDVIRIKELLESLREEEASRRPNSPVPDTPIVDRNPVYQQMKMAFNQADIELSQLTAQRADQEKIVKNLRQKIDTIPEIEAELTRLNRNYDVNKVQHDELLGRLEQARLSEDAERSSSALKFRVIDPPIVTPLPVGPNRALFFSAGLLLAIAGGLGFAGLRSIASPVFYSSHKLERRFGRPVLGTITKANTIEEQSRARRNTAMLSIVLAGLIGCYGSLLVFERSGVQLMSRLIGMIG